MRLPIDERARCTRFSAVVFVVAAVGHLTLLAWLSRRPGEGPTAILDPVFLLTPYLVLALVT